MKTIWEAIKEAARDFGQDNGIWVDQRMAQLLSIEYEKEEVKPEVAYAKAYQHFMCVEMHQ